MIFVPVAEFRKTIGHRIEADIESIAGVGMGGGCSEKHGPKRSPLLNFKFAQNGPLLILKWQSKDSS